jgi:hypothetical protein
MLYFTFLAWAVLYEYHQFYNYFLLLYMYNVRVKSDRDQPPLEEFDILKNNWSNARPNRQKL